MCIMLNFDLRHLIKAYRALQILGAFPLDSLRVARVKSRQFCVLAPTFAESKAEKNRFFAHKTTNRNACAGYQDYEPIALIIRRLKYVTCSSLCNHSIRLRLSCSLFYYRELNLHCTPLLGFTLRSL